MGSQPPLVDDYDAEFRDPDGGDVAVTRWPTVIGVLSLIYAGLGLLCGVTTAAWTLLMDRLFSAFSFNVVAPPQIKIVGVLTALVGTGLALVMFLGAIALVRRRRRGVGLLKAWAMLRVIWLIIGLGLGLWLMPAQIKFQLAIQQAQVDAAKADGREVPAHLLASEEQLWSRTVIMTAVSTGVLAMYPTFIIFYLSRRKIADEVTRWP